MRLILWQYFGWLLSSLGMVSTSQEGNLPQGNAAKICETESTNCLETPVDLNSQIATISLREMSNHGYFSIATFQDCQRVLEAQTSKLAMTRLEVLHGIEFDDMTPDVLKFVEKCCTDLFGHNTTKSLPIRLLK